MRLYRFFVCLLIAGCFLGALVPQGGSAPLQGGIKHAERLDPVSPQLRTGTEYTDIKLKEAVGMGLCPEGNYSGGRHQLDQGYDVNIAKFMGATRGGSTSTIKQAFTDLAQGRGLESVQGITPAGAAQGITSNRWVRVPAWFAARWQRQEQYLLSQANFDNNDFSERDIRQRQSAISLTNPMITQRDNSGNIWALVQIGPPVMSSGSNGTFHHIGEICKVLSMGDPNMIRLVVFNIRVHEKGGFIVAVDRMEEIQNITLAPNGNEIRVIESRMLYDEQGNSRGATEVAGWYSQRAEDCPPVDSYQGLDVRKMFSEFANQEGYGHIVDNSPRAPQNPSNQNPYGGQQPFGNPPYQGGQQPYGGQQPFGNPPYQGGTQPYGGQQPFGNPPQRRFAPSGTAPGANQPVNQRPNLTDDF